MTDALHRRVQWLKTRASMARNNGDHILHAELEETAEMLIAFDIPAEQAASLASGMDHTMGACVLSLYRSAAQPEMAQLGQRLGTTEKRPGLVFLPTEDPFCGTHAMCESMADALGARVARLDGLGHWWMFAGAAAAADALVEHW